VDNAEYPASLELHKVYRVLPDREADRHGDLRVIDESGEDYLYPADFFVPVDLPRSTVRALNRSYTRRMAKR
jgi:molybdopterin-guanine dinucleotide biosynthesis protein A